MADAAWELQKAVFAKLDGDATLGDLISGVFDHVPAEQAFPYVTVGDDTAVWSGAMTVDGQEHTLTMHVWSRGRGRKEAKEIMDRIHTVLHDAALTVTGFTFIALRYEFGQTFMDEDGLTRHGVMRFRAITRG